MNQTRISAWGNSSGIRLPLEMLSAIGLKVGDGVVLTRVGNGVMVAPESPPKTLASMLQDFDPLSHRYEAPASGRQEHAPDRGEVVALPGPKREHVLVISSARFNQLSGLVVVCPITDKPQGSPVEVPLDGPAIVGAVLPQLVHTITWEAGQLTLVDRPSAAVMKDVTEHLAVILGAETP